MCRRACGVSASKWQVGRCAVSDEPRPMSDAPNGAPLSPPSREEGAPTHPQGELSGPELARAALEAARARREAARPRRRSTEGAGDGAAGGGRRPRGYSGPGPDPRDPQSLASVLARLVKTRGWQRPTAEATVFGAWERVVGADIGDGFVTKLHIHGPAAPSWNRGPRRVRGRGPRDTYG